MLRFSALSLSATLFLCTALFYASMVPAHATDVPESPYSTMNPRDIKQPVTIGRGEYNYLKSLPDNDTRNSTIKRLAVDPSYRAEIQEKGQAYDDSFSSIPDYSAGESTAKRDAYGMTPAQREAAAQKLYELQVKRDAELAARTDLNAFSTSRYGDPSRYYSTESIKNRISAFDKATTTYRNGKNHKFSDPRISPFATDRATSLRDQRTRNRQQAVISPFKNRSLSGSNDFTSRARGQQDVSGNNPYMRSIYVGSGETHQGTAANQYYVQPSYRIDDPLNVLGGGIKHDQKHTPKEFSKAVKTYEKRVQQQQDYYASDLYQHKNTVQSAKVPVVTSQDQEMLQHLQNATRNTPTHSSTNQDGAYVGFDYRRRIPAGYSAFHGGRDVRQAGTGTYYNDLTQSGRQPERPTTISPFTAPAGVRHY